MVQPVFAGMMAAGLFISINKIFCLINRLCVKSIKSAVSLYILSAFSMTVGFCGKNTLKRAVMGSSGSIGCRVIGSKELLSSD